MKIHEYQAKEILHRYNVPIPPGEVASTPQEARDIAFKIGKPVVVKAQVLVGGRGKAGGVKIAQDPDEAAQKAEQILGMKIKDIPVSKVLVTQAEDIAREIYLGAIVDRTTKRVVFLTSAEGGVEIEEVARVAPEKIVKIGAEPFLGLADYQARELGYRINIPKEHMRTFTQIAHALYQAMVDLDGSLVEVNPLVITTDNRMLALDAKMNFDDNGLYRHPEIEQMRDLTEEEPAEITAREAGLSYVKLDGNIGCMVNGAGLAMATMDVIKLYGGEPANFLDIGGGARADRVIAALKIILSDPNVVAVLFNIFGGITRGDEVARGIVTALQSPDIPRRVPMVVRLVGTNAEEGRRILEEANLVAVDNMDDAARRVVEIAKQQAGGGR